MFTQHGSYVFLVAIFPLLFLLTSVHSILFFDNDVCSRLSDGSVNLVLLGTYTYGRLLLITDDGLVHEESSSSWEPTTTTLKIESSPKSLMEKWPLLYQKVGGNLNATMKAALVHFGLQDYIMVELDANEVKKRRFVFQDLDDTDNVTEYVLNPMKNKAQAVSSLIGDQLAISRRKDGNICVYKLDFKSTMVWGFSFRLSARRCTTGQTLASHYNHFFALNYDSRIIYAFSNKDKIIRALDLDDKTLQLNKHLITPIRSMLICPLGFLQYLIICAIALSVFCIAAICVIKCFSPQKEAVLAVSPGEPKSPKEAMSPLPKSTLRTTPTTTVQSSQLDTPSSKQVVISAPAEPPLISVKSMLKSVNAIREVPSSSSSAALPDQSHIESGIQSTVTSAQTQSVFSHGSSTVHSSAVGSTLTSTGSTITSGTSTVALPDTGSQAPNRSSYFSSPSKTNRPKVVLGGGSKVVANSSVIGSVVPSQDGGKNTSSVLSKASHSGGSAVLP